MCFAQGDAGQVFDTLAQSPKIIESELVLDDFLDGSETTRVIVTLSEPSNFQQKRELGPTSPDNSRSLKNLAFRNELQMAVQAAQEQVISRLDPGNVQITNRFTYIFGFSAEVTLEGLKALEELDEVVSISKDRILEAHLAQGIPLMNASTVRNTYNGSGIAIAICDTGIDYTHPRLGGGGFPNSKVIGGYDCGDDDINPMDVNGHGTCCAGIAAGDLGTVWDYVGGVAHNAKLYAVKISFGAGGFAWTADTIEGWEWCITHQNDDPANPIMVISTSFGGEYYTSHCDFAVPAMTIAAQNAVSAGITLFVSSGNDGGTDGMGWPACISHVNSVGAVYDDDVGPHYYSICIDLTTDADQVTCYSNSASFLTLFAPSHDAYTADIVGPGGYSAGDYYPTFGGTSAACPYSAGSAACLQSAAQAITGSFLTPAEVQSSLTSTGDLVTDPKVPSVTKPRINLQAAVDALGGSPGIVMTSPVVTGDLNGDGSADIAGIDTGGKVWYTTDLSTWTDIPGRTLEKIKTGDLDGDGDEDIVGVDASGRIWYTTNLSTWINIRGRLVEIVTGDLDGDGNDDIAGASAIGKVWYTTNLGTIWTNIPGRTLEKMKTGDLDGDGDDDIAGVDASGKISYTTDLSSWIDIRGRLVEIVTGDLDGDGDDDIAGANAIGKVWYTTNLGTIWTNIPGRTLEKMKTGDLDGDGDDDIAGVDASGKIWYTTNLSTWINIRGRLVEIVTGDLNGDGDDDIAGANAIGNVWYTTDLSTWINIPLP